MLIVKLNNTVMFSYILFSLLSSVLPMNICYVPISF